MTTIPQLSQILQNLLIEDANRIGRESGFIQRQRKLSGASFAQSLIFGWQANPQASLEELCQSANVCGVEISPQGLQERLNFKVKVFEQLNRQEVWWVSRLPARVGIWQDTHVMHLC